MLIENGSVSDDVVKSLNSELVVPTEIFSVLQHITLTLDNKKITSMRNPANLPHDTTPQTSIHLSVTHTFCFIFHKVLTG